ncbi:hypothetical protein LCGC14_3089210, partial [marine sediment metagenome]
ILNNDYSHKATAQFHFSKPKVGFQEDNLFCTRIIWSEERGINAIDSPGIRTFKEESRFDISDNQGEIKFAWDAISERGSNLYAFTDSGICLLMTDKRILSDANAKELAIIGSDAEDVILEQLWISKDVGMHDEMWRTAAGFDNSLFFANHNSVYGFKNDSWADIGRNKYHNTLRENILDGIAEGYEDAITGTYDRLNNEYWITFDRKREEEEASFEDFTFIIDTGVVLEVDIGGGLTIVLQDTIEVEDNSILTLTGTSTGTANPIVSLASFNPTYALTARDLVICAPNESAPLDIVFPSGSGSTLLLTLTPGLCACVTAILQDINGTFLSQGGGLADFTFPQGTDLS